MVDLPRTASPGEHLTSLHIQKAIGNDRESVAWLISRFTPLLLCQARQRIGPSLRRHCDPDDVVADVWMIVLAALRDLTPSAGSFTQALLSFSSTILIRRLRDLLEKHVINKPGTVLLGTPDAAEAALRAIYRPRYDALAGGTGEAATLLRRALVNLLALDAHDPKLREELSVQADRYVGANGELHTNAAPGDLLGAVLAVGVQDLGAPFFEVGR